MKCSAYTVQFFIFWLSSQETGLYEYKVFGTLSGCCPEVCADVYMDLDYRKQWDSYVKGNVRAGYVSSYETGVSRIKESRTQTHKLRNIETQWWWEKVGAIFLRFRPFN